MQTRRLIAVAVIIVVVILIALLVHGCESNQNRNSLRDYNASVSTLITRSDHTGRSLFADLKGAAGAGESKVSNQLNGLLAAANTQLHDTQSLNVPGPMTTAQRNLSLTMTMRRDGIARIAANIQQALNTSTAQDGVNQIALAGANFYGSDAVYMNYVVPELARALNGAGVSVGGTDGVQINGHQFLGDLGWLDKSTIASWIGAKGSSSGRVNTVGSGTHGHELNYTTVGGTQLSAASTNTVTGTAPPAFTLNLTNSGTNTEYDVGCRVSVAGLDDAGRATIPKTTPGETTTCTVTLPSAPPAGTYQVKAEVLKVPGESNLANNRQTYSVTFAG